MPGSSQRPSDMTLAELLRSLKPGQVWGALTACVAVIGGAWFFGYWSSEQSSAFELKSKDLTIAELQSELSDKSEATISRRDEIKFLDRKVRLLSLLVLFNEASEKQASAIRAMDQNPGGEGVDEAFLAARNRLMQIGDNILRFVQKLDEETGATGSSEIQVRLGKGISGQTITFLEDGSVWPLPSSLFATAN